MRGRWRRISVIPTTAISLASTIVWQPAARMRSPPNPKTSTSGRERRRASISCAPYMSPEASPAEMRTRRGRGTEGWPAVVEGADGGWSLVVGKGGSVVAGYADAGVSCSRGNFLVLVLQLIKLPVNAALGQQLLVAAHFAQFALMHDQDLVRALHRG